jgi:Subtilase family
LLASAAVIAQAAIFKHPNRRMKAGAMRPSRMRGMAAAAAIITAGTLVATGISAMPASAGPPGPAAPDQSPNAKIAPEVKSAFSDGGPVEVLVSYTWQKDSAAAQQASGSVARMSRKEHNKKLVSELGKRYGATKKATLAKSGPQIKVVEDYSTLPSQLLRIPSLDAARELAADPNVASLQPNTAIDLELTESLPLINQPAVAESGYKGAGASVAVLDTGVDYRKSDFGSCSGAGGSCVVSIARDFAKDDKKLDDNGHGTNVAGIVHGVAPDAKILALDVFDKKGALSSDIKKAIDWVVANQADYKIASMNLSLGDDSHHTSECTDSSFTGDFATAGAIGVIPVVSAGNSAYESGKYKTGVGFPACTPGAIRVGAVYDSNVGRFRDTEKGHECTDSATDADVIACFSQGGPLVSLYAPGAKITAAGYTDSGTSQAAPHVAGAVAVLNRQEPDASAYDIAASLGHSSVGLTDPRENNDSGFQVWPRLDLKAASSALTKIVKDKSISDGTVRLGVGTYGDLNAPDDSGKPTGLIYLPTDADALSPGCLCEGWGLADRTSGVFGLANEAQGITNLTAVSYKHTNSTATSVVNVGGGLEVNHNFHPTKVDGLYEVTVTIKNIGLATTGPLAYRRVLDWDVPPTPFSEYVTLAGSTAAGVTYLSDNGFASANPLTGAESIISSGDVVDSGPADHGTVIDLNLGSLAEGESTTFQLYYGASASEEAALSALTSVGAMAYSLGQPSTADGPTLGQPNTFFFGYSK